MKYVRAFCITHLKNKEIVAKFEYFEQKLNPFNPPMETSRNWIIAVENVYTLFSKVPSYVIRTNSALKSSGIRAPFTYLGVNLFLVILKILRSISVNFTRNGNIFANFTFFDINHCNGLMKCEVVVS